MRLFTLTALSICLTACASNNTSQIQANVVTARLGDHAQSMVIPHPVDDPYSFYGIELGSTKESVEKGFTLNGCHDDAFLTRCWVQLDITNTTGVYVGQSVPVFLTFKGGSVV